jgi:NADPH:quinone reductase-like Zn-dependent oxidoreductase
MRQIPPMVVGYEVSGVVDAIGAGVDAQWLGREVFALVRLALTPSRTAPCS